MRTASAGEPAASTRTVRRSSMYRPAYASAVPPVPRTATIGRRCMYAAHISESVPAPPPITTTPSADRALTKSRVSPIPVGMTMSHASLACRWASCGMMPTTRPPPSRAPRLAAPITPPSPPVSSAEPDRAISRPASYAASSCSRVQCLPSLCPMTSICRMRPGRAPAGRAPSRPPPPPRPPLPCTAGRGRACQSTFRGAQARECRSGRARPTGDDGEAAWWPGPRLPTGGEPAVGERAYRRMAASTSSRPPFWCISAQLTHVKWP